MVNSGEVVVWRVRVGEGEKCGALIEEEGGDSEVAPTTADGKCLPGAYSPYWVTACTQECNVAISGKPGSLVVWQYSNLHT